MGNISPSFIGPTNPPTIENLSSNCPRLEQTYNILCDTNDISRTYLEEIYNNNPPTHDIGTY
jgi:hypothetical protein